ncbi:hypothetical protein DFH09DRAFT_1104427 [Mycena vulgaris]|nr:hypothetical protein DFH09DRAFT_1104427 [Mycena vulgaris]
MENVARAVACIAEAAGGAAWVRKSACTMVAHLSRDATTVAAILTVDLCPQLLDLLRSKIITSSVTNSATYALAYRPEGAEAAVKANALACVTGMFRITNFIIFLGQSRRTQLNIFVLGAWRAAT